MCFVKLWTMTFMITKKELYKLYIKQNLSCTQIASLKKMGSTTVLNYLKKYNIPRKNSGAQVKYIAVNDYFNTWSDNMAYCLGFIAADGHVWKDRPYITICVHKDDIQVLNFIRDQISPMSKVRLSQDKCQLCIYSRNIHSRLVSLGVDHNKTFNLKFPKIPKNISVILLGVFLMVMAVFGKPIFILEVKTTIMLILCRHQETFYKACKNI